MQETETSIILNVNKQGRKEKQTNKQVGEVTTTEKSDRQTNSKTLHYNICYYTQYIFWLLHGQFINKQ
jgi:hypothetical protein